MGVADSCPVASGVDGVHHGEGTADAKGEAEKEADDGGRRKTHVGWSVTGLGSHAVIDDREQGPELVRGFECGDQYGDFEYDAKMAPMIVCGVNNWLLVWCVVL